MQRQHLFRYFFWFSLVFLFFTSTSFTHPFFISVTEIRVDASKQSMNISCRMFTDDLQGALLKLYQYKANLEAGDNAASPFLTKYINERLQIKVDNKPVDFKFIGYETEDEATWCYLEATTFPGIGPASVNDGLLFDFIPEQTNLIHFYRNGVRTSVKLVNPERVAGF